MQTENGAAAPSDGQATNGAPAESEQATPNAGVPNAADAAAENAETNEAEQSQQAEWQDEEGKPTKLTRNQRLQRKAARLATMVAELSAENESLKKGKSPDSDAPKPADYPQGEYDPGYLTDLAAHKAAQKIGSQMSERDERDAKEKAVLARQEAAEDFVERAEELKTSIPDFVSTLEAFAKGGGQFAPHVIEELHESEKGPLLAYQLAKNPALASSLNQMSPRDVAREIGRLEAKSSLPQPRKQTQAQPPIAPLTGGASPSSQDARLDAWMKKQYGSRA